jgi:hypothetical protein
LIQTVDRWDSTRGRGTLIVVFTVLHFVFFLSSILAIPILAPGARIPNPYGLDADSRAFFLQAATTIRFSDFLQLASALCLAVMSPLLGAALQSIRKNTSAWLTVAGGLGAAAMLSISALASWAIASPGAVDMGTSFHTFKFLPFLFGGPAWAGFFAIFLAGLSSGTVGLVPRWLGLLGYFLTCVAALATVVLVTIFASPCLPIARFLGFLWLIVVAVLMARTRNHQTQ